MAWQPGGDRGKRGDGFPESGRWVWASMHNSICASGGSANLQLMQRKFSTWVQAAATCAGRTLHKHTRSPTTYAAKFRTGHGPGIGDPCCRSRGSLSCTCLVLSLQWYVTYVSNLIMSRAGLWRIAKFFPFAEPEWAWPAHNLTGLEDRLCSFSTDFSIFCLYSKVVKGKIEYLHNFLCLVMLKTLYLIAIWHTRLTLDWTLTNFG